MPTIPSVVAAATDQLAHFEASRSKPCKPPTSNKASFTHSFALGPSWVATTPAPVASCTNTKAPHCWSQTIPLHAGLTFSFPKRKSPSFPSLLTSTALLIIPQHLWQLLKVLMVLSFKGNTALPSARSWDGPHHVLASLLLIPNFIARKQHPEHLNL